MAWCQEEISSPGGQVSACIPAGLVGLNRSSWAILLRAVGVLTVVHSVSTINRAPQMPRCLMMLLLPMRMIPVLLPSQRLMEDCYCPAPQQRNWRLTHSGLLMVTAGTWR